MILIIYLHKEGWKQAEKRNVWFFIENSPSVLELYLFYLGHSEKTPNCPSLFEMNFVLDAYHTTEGFHRSN